MDDAATTPDRLIDEDSPDRRKHVPLPFGLRNRLVSHVTTTHAEDLARPLDRQHGAIGEPGGQRGRENYCATLQTAVLDRHQ